MEGRSLFILTIAVQECVPPLYSEPSHRNSPCGNKYHEKLRTSQRSVPYVILHPVDLVVHTSQSALCIC